MILRSDIPEKLRVVRRVDAFDHFPYCAKNENTTKTVLTLVAAFSLLIELIIDYWYMYFLVKQNVPVMYGFITVCVTGMISPILTLCRIFIPSHASVSITVSFFHTVALFNAIMFMFMHINALSFGVGADLLYGHILMIVMPLLFGTLIKFGFYVVGILDMMMQGKSEYVTFKIPGYTRKEDMRESSRN